MTSRREHAKIFGRWLNTTMANRGISGRSLATKVGVNDSVISRWRSGVAVPSMENCGRLADALGEEPLRVAVTAGIMPKEMAGVEPLPMPEPTALRRQVIDQIAGIRGLTDETRNHMIAAFDEHNLKENED